MGGADVDWWVCNDDGMVSCLLVILVLPILSSFSVDAVSCGIWAVSSLGGRGMVLAAANCLRNLATSDCL